METLKLPVYKSRQFLCNASDSSYEKLPLKPLDITSIIGNIIDNAIDAVDNNVDNKRIININLDKNNGFFVIEISNTGTIPNEIVNNIFNFGYSTKESTGLGLPTAKQLVTRYKGYINLINNNEATTFIIHIPIKGG